MTLPLKYSRNRAGLTFALVALLVLTALPMSPRPGFAHSVVGDYTFVEPLVADDPDPRLNDFDVIKPGLIFGGSSGRQLGLGSLLSKQLGENFGLEIQSAWIQQNHGAGVVDEGFDVVTLIPKYVLLVNAEHELLLSAGALMMFPVGNQSVQFHNYTELGPELGWEKGLGDLPDNGPVKYLRALGLEGDMGYAPALAGPAYHWLFADVVVQYSFGYLAAHVLKYGLPASLTGLYAFTEFNYNQAVAGPSGQRFPLLYVTPGVAYMTRAFQISVAGQFALNNAAASSVSNGAVIPYTHGAVLLMLDIALDDVLPAARWTPF